MELKKLMDLTIFMSFFGTIANDCTAVMTVIAFGIL